MVSDFFSEGIAAPEDLDALSTVLDRACQHLNVSKPSSEFNDLATRLVTLVGQPLDEDQLLAALLAKPNAV